MIRWLLTTMAWRDDGITLVAVDHYANKETCQTMGRLAFDWFGVDWTCTMTIFV